MSLNFDIFAMQSQTHNWDGAAGGAAGAAVEEVGALRIIFGCSKLGVRLGFVYFVFAAFVAKFKELSLWRMLNNTKRRQLQSE